MNRPLIARLERRAAGCTRMADRFRQYRLPHSASEAEADAELLLQAARALQFQDGDLDELARAHVEGSEGRP